MSTAQLLSAPLSQRAMTIISARGQFPGVTHHTYLDTATVGLAPHNAVREIQGFLDRVAICPSQSGTAHHVALKNMYSTARPVLARLLGCGPEDVALVESTTHGLSVAARSLPLRPGDRVVYCDLEFVQMGAVWSQMARHGIGVDVVPHRLGRVTVDSFRERIGPRTRVLAVSSVQWTNGFRVDLDGLSQLCRDHGLWMLVDAAQHLGVLPIDLGRTPVDLLVSSGHKWLNAPFGTGVMYLSPSARERLELPVAGFFAAAPPNVTWGRSFQEPDTSPLMDFSFVRDAAAWENGGTTNVAGAIGLAASSELALRIGIGTIEAHVRKLTGRLIEGLDRIGVAVVGPRAERERSGIVAVSVGESAANVAAMNYLLSAGIACSVRYTSGVGGIRISCHYYNVEDDIDVLLDALGRWLHAEDPAAQHHSVTAAGG